MSSQQKSGTPHGYRAVYVQGHHWDPEWYLPFQGFRARFVRVVDSLLEILDRREAFRFFFLDGQTSLLEDYVAVRPENRERLTAFIRDGRIHVGPWFTMPDEFLPSGEALVRNLLTGSRVARAFGGDTHRVGYVCDMFGQNSQLPQILRGFGIDNAVFGRGANDETGPVRFRWAAADGSEVLGLKIPDGGMYGMCNAFRVPRWNSEDPLDVDAAADGLIAVARAEQQRTGMDTVLVLDSFDHCPAEEAMVDVLHRAGEKAPEWEFTWASLETYVDQVRPLSADWAVRQGELREPARAAGPVLNNVFSSRIPLKQANVHCQTLLECWAEPLAVLAEPFGYDGGAAYRGMAWKHLLRNHAHDSICGCSLDQVHQDMRYRFDQARLLGEVVRREAAEAVAYRTAVATEDGDTVFQVWNPLPVEREVVADLRLPLPCEEDESVGRHDPVDSQTFELLDGAGGAVPYQVLRRGSPVQTSFQRPHGYSVFEMRRPVEVAARLRLPAAGYTTLIVRKLARRRLVRDSMSPSPGVMENETLRVAIGENGNFSLTDKRNGAVYRDLGALEDTADVGDGWNHFRPVCDEIYSSRASSATVAKVADGSEKVTYRVTRRLNLPVEFDTRRGERSSTHREVDVAHELTLRRGGDTLECETRIENVVRDHCLRLLLPTDLDVDEALSETPFDVVRRPVRLMELDGYREPDQEVKPMTRFLAAHDGQRGLALTTEGLHEAGVREDERRTMLVTLCRSFARNWSASVLDQPGGQVQGELRLRWQLAPLAGPWNAAEVERKARAFTAGLYTHVVQWACPEADLPAEQELMSLESGELSVTALKPAEQGASTILRLVNYGERPAAERVRFSRAVARFRPCRLDEEPTGPWQEPQGGWLPVEAAPKRIVSLEIEWA